MLESAIMSYATGKVDFQTFSAAIGIIASLHKAASGTSLLQQYVTTHEFSPVHKALLYLDGEPTIQARSVVEERLTDVINKIPCEVDRADNKGRSPLTLAVEFRSFSSVRILLDLKASPNFVRESISGVKMPLLHLLLAGPTDNEKNIIDIAEALLDAGADIAAEDSEGWTALHIAASWNMYDVSSMLLKKGDRGVLLTALTYQRETAYDLATNSGCSAQLLRLLLPTCTICA